VCPISSQDGFHDAPLNGSMDPLPWALSRTKKKKDEMKKLLFGVWLALSAWDNALAEEANSVVVEVLTKTDSSWDGKALPRYLRGKPEISILKFTIPPGVQLPLHKHRVINAGVLTRGELTVVTEDNKVLHMKAGDTIVEVVNKWHYGMNEGNEPAEIIIFYAGSRRVPVTIKKEP
jgi:quercetin dioxygenase-like cupin family protein